MWVKHAENAPVHLCIDSNDYKEKIEVNVKRSEASKTIKRRWAGKIGQELVVDQQPSLSGSA
jgi:hypothetical protein